MQTNDHKGDKIQQLLHRCDVVIYDIAAFTTETLSALKGIVCLSTAKCSRCIAQGCCEGVFFSLFRCSLLVYN